MPANYFYPSVSELISSGQLPKRLRLLLEKVLDNTYNHFYYKNHQYFQSVNGSQGYHQLTLVLYKKMQWQLGAPGTLVLTINPNHSTSNPTEIPVRIAYNLDAFVYFQELGELNLSEETEGVFDAIFELLNLDLDEVLDQVLQKYYPVSSDPVASFVSDYNANSDYSGYPNLTVPAIGNPDRIGDVLDELQVNGHAVAEIIYNSYLDVSDEIEEVLENVYEFFNYWLPGLVKSHLKDSLSPQVSASLQIPDFAISFPRWLLQPVDINGAVIADPTQLSELVFDIGELVYDTRVGFTYDSLTFNSFTKSTILSTGLILDLTGVSIDLREDSNSIQAADDEDRSNNFKGIFVSQVQLDFPQDWNIGSGQTASLVVQDMLIGSEGGFSGQITLLNGPLSTSMLGIELIFANFDITFVKNSLAEFTIDGSLSIPGLKEHANPSNDASIDFNIGYDEGLYEITCSNFPTISIFSQKLTISSLGLSIYENKIALFELIADLEIQGITDAITGNPAILGIDASFDFQNQLYSVTGSNFPTVKLFGMAFAINTLSFDWDDTSITNFLLAGDLTANAFKNTAGTANEPIAISIGYNGITYSLSATGPITTKFFGQTLTINSITGAFTTSGSLTSFSVDAILEIDQIKNTNGTTRQIDIDIDYDGTDFSIALSGGSFTNLELFGMNLTINSIGGTFSEGAGLTAFDIDATLEIDHIQNTAGTAPEPIGITISYDAVNYSIGLSGSALTNRKLFGMELDINSISASFTKTALTSFTMASMLRIDQLKEAGQSTPADIGINLGYDGTVFDVAVSGGIPSFELGGVTITATALAMQFTKGAGLTSFTLSGTLAHDAFVDNGGNPVTPSFTTGYDGTTYTVSVAGLSIDAKGIPVSLNAFSISFTNSGLSAILIGGTMTLPNVEDGSGSPAVVNIQLELDGNDFSIKAGYPTGLSLKVPNVLDFTLYELTIGKEAGLWYIAFGTPPGATGVYGALLEIMLDIPILGKFIPEEVGINSLRINQDVTTQDEMFYLKWPQIDGLDVTAGGGVLDVSMPLQISMIGGLELNGLRLRMNSQATPTTIAVTVSGSLAFGPFIGAVQDVGVQVSVEQAAGNGNFGPFDIGDYEIVPPSGIGISIDSSVINGGGYLSFDQAKGEYAGAIELQLKNIALKAIGILNTKLPDGSDGYSLLIIITAEFNPQQIGMGFTLMGVGGVLGTNRRANLDVVRSGLRTGTLDNVLFPTNIVQNAPRIISDLKTVFPIAMGRFILGPMGKLGWGTPTLITAEIGVILELPAPVRIAILGVIKSILPSEDKPLLKLQVNFLGVIDFQKKLISFDASIYDSKLLNFGLAGDMAVRVGWGGNKLFILSVGGFHPLFQPPPGLTGMSRLMMTIRSSQPRITLETYFAVTSNTVQFGARVELYHKLKKKYYIEGRLGFDALFQFNPFYFILYIYFSLAVKRKGRTKLGISLEFTLEGPTPWKVKGKAKFKICRIKFKARFSASWGQSDTQSLPNTNVYPQLEAALDDDNNWSIIMPKGKNELVTLRQLGADEYVINPAGKLKVSQKVVPLDLHIERIGNMAPTNPGKFSITEVRVGAGAGTVMVKENVKEDFAPSQYRNMNPTQKLSSASFVQYNSGATFKGSDQLVIPSYVKRTIKYETALIDSGQLDILTPTEEEADVLEAMAGSAIAGRTKLSHTRNAKSVLAPAAVTLVQERFGVVGTDLSLHNTSSMHDSREEALDYKAELIQLDPTLLTQLQVLPAYEIA